MVGTLLAHLAVLAVVVDAAAGAVAVHLEEVAVVRHHGHHPREQTSHVLQFKVFFKCSDLKAYFILPKAHDS